MKIFLICIIPVLLFSLGCQSNRKKVAMRCLYDQSVFADAITRAMRDEELFKTFKREPFYALAFQGHSYEEGLTILESIEKEYPFLIEAFERFRTSDHIGGPQTFDYGKYGVFSPTTLHHVRVAGNVTKELTSLPCEHIVQIGAGYGGLCKILNDLKAWKKYTLIDLPEHLALAKRVLEKQGICTVSFNVSFLTPQEVTKEVACDLVISDLSFSEFSRPVQQLFIDRIFVCARAGFLIGHTFPKHFGVESFSPHVFKDALKKVKQHVQFEMADANVERTNYTLSWRNSS